MCFAEEFKDGRQFGAVSSSVAPRKRKEDVTLQQKPCSYRDACARYLKSLALPGIPHLTPVLYAV